MRTKRTHSLGVFVLFAYDWPASRDPHMRFPNPDSPYGLQLSYGSFKRHLLCTRLA